MNIFWTHPEILRIHMQFVAMQLTQFSKGALEVVHVLNGISKGSQHLLAMSFDLRVAHYGRRRGQVAKVVKEPLGPGVDDQEPIGWNHSIWGIKDSPILNNFQGSYSPSSPMH